jgi:hypothetical protein
MQEDDANRIRSCKIWGYGYEEYSLLRYTRNAL